MGARTIPDGAAVTNHFLLSFGTWVTEANATSVSGFSDETEVIDGPDGRGYSTGKASRQTLMVDIPSHDPASKLMHAWREACEHGAPGHVSSGVATVMDAGDNVVAVYELQHCICHKFEATDFKLDGAEVAMDKFSVSVARIKRVA